MRITKQYSTVFRVTHNSKQNDFIPHKLQKSDGFKLALSYQHLCTYNSSLSTILRCQTEVELWNSLLPVRVMIHDVAI